MTSEAGTQCSATPQPVCCAISDVGGGSCGASSTSNPTASLVSEPSTARTRWCPRCSLLTSQSAAQAVAHTAAVGTAVHLLPSSLYSKPTVPAGAASPTRSSLAAARP